MRANKKITLLASILTASTLMAMPLITMVNNVSSNTSVVTGGEDNQITSEQASNQIEVVEERVGSTVTMTINSNECNVGSSIATEWMGITSGGLVIFEIDDSVLTATVKNVSAITITSSNLKIPGSITYNGNTYNVVFIGDGAFRGCKGITGALTIPTTVTSIGVGAFADCTKLNGALIIPTSVISIRNQAFSNCSGLDSVSIPTSVISIGVQTFNSCSGLTDALTIPSGLASIGINAFSSCKFTSIDIDDGNTKYCKAKNLGANCDAIMDKSTNGIFDGSSIIVGSLACGQLDFAKSNVTNIVAKAFQGCSGLTGTLAIPTNVTTIGNDAFTSCIGLDGLDLSNATSLQTISDQAFYNCSGLSGGLTIPASVTTIGFSAFNGCSGLTGTLTIPSSVTSIGDEAFIDCSNLKNCSFLSKTPPTDLGDNIFGFGDSTITINVPKGAKDTWVTTPGIKEKLGIASLDQINELITPDPQPTSGFPWWAYLIIIGATTVLVSALAITIITLKRKNNEKINKK